MAELNTTVLEVDAGKSVTTLKEFKKHLDDLRGTVLSLKEGTEDYDKAVEELRNEQQRLNDVMKIGKGYADAAEGSYNHLVNTMAELKKQWRATADEAERADLGKKILEINNQLKELDASTGNFQRNVGDYSNAFEEAFKKSLTTLTGMDGAVGTLSKDILGLMPLIKNVVKASTTGLKGIKAALASSGIGLIAIALGEIIVHWKDIYEWTNKTLGLHREEEEAIRRSERAMEDFKRSVENTNTELDKQVRLLAARGATDLEVLQYQQAQLEKQKQELNDEIFRKQGAVDRLEGAHGVSKKEREAMQAELDQMRDQLKNIDAEIAKTSTDIEVAKAKAETDATKQAEADAKAAQAKAEAAAKTLQENIEKAKAGVKDFTTYTSGEYTSIFSKLTSGLLTDREKIEKEYEDTFQNLTKLADEEKKHVQGLADDEIKYYGLQLKAKKITADEYQTYVLDVNQRLADKNLEIDNRYLDAKTLLAMKKEKDITDFVGKEAEKKAKLLVDNYKNAISRLEKDVDLKVDLEVAQNPGELKDVFSPDKIAGYYDRLIGAENTLYEARQSGLTNLISGLTAQLETVQSGSSEYISIQQQITEANMELSDLETEHTINNLNLVNDKEEEVKEARKKRMALYVESLNGVAGILGTLSSAVQAEAQEEYENGKISEETAKQRFEDAKSMAYASTAVNMAAGIMSAVAHAMDLGFPMGPIVGAIESAAVLATGIAQLAAIKRQKFNSSGGGSSASYSNATPKVNEYTPEYTATATNQTELTELGNAMSKQQLFVSVTDIDSVQNTVKTREEETTF